MYSFSTTKIRDSPFSLFSYGIRAKGGKKPNYFRFIRESILGNLLVTVFHFGHLSHLLKLSDQPYRCQKPLTAIRKPLLPSENPRRRRLFQRLFPAKSFSDTNHTIRCARRRSSSFVEAPERDSQPRAGHVRFFSDDLNLTHFHLQPRLTPSSHPPSVLVPFEPCKCIFLGFLSPPAL